MQWTASQMIAVLIDRLGGMPQVFSIDELKAFRSSLPMRVHGGRRHDHRHHVQDDERLPNAMR